MTNTAYKTRKLLSMLSCAEKENDGLMLTHNLQNMQRNGKQTGCYGHIMNLLIFENKDTIYDICDAVRCTKALYMAAQNDFNNISLETLNAAAEILGVKYDKVKRK